MATETDRSEDIQKYHDYYYGDIDALRSGYLARFSSSDVDTDDQLAKRNFVTMNEIRAIIEKRISMIPIAEGKYTVVNKDGATNEALTEWLNRWLDEPNFGDSLTFDDFALEVSRFLEIDGEVLLKMILKNGTPAVRRWPDENMTIESAPDNLFDVISYRTEWTRTRADKEGDSDTYEIVETIDKAAYTLEIDSAIKTESHGYSFIPAVHIRREEVEGEANGRSAIADLVEPQDNINRCLTHIGLANKYGALAMYTASEPDAIPDNTSISIAPGSVIPFPISKVTSDGAAQALFDDLNQHLDAIYRIAGLSRNKTEEMSPGSAASGKAIIVMNAQGRRYVADVLSRCGRGFARMCQYALVMGSYTAAPDDVKVLVEFPSLDQEDSQSVMDKARFFEGMGFIEESLRLLGYDDAAVERLMQERESSPDKWESVVSDHSGKPADMVAPKSPDDEMLMKDDDEAE